MASMLGAVLLIAGVFVGVAVFMLWLTDKTAKRAVTRYFQDAEYITEHQTPPPAWSKERRGISAGGHDHPEQRKAAVMKRMDELIAFFESSPFFEDEETRALLLAELKEARDSWATQNPTDITDTNENRR